MRLYPDLCNRYITEAGRVRTPTSAKTFKKVIRFCQSQFPDHKLGDWTADDLTEFCLSNGAAAATIKQRRAHITALFEWAAYKRLITSNVAADLKYTVQPGKGRVRLGTWLSEDQLRTIVRSYGVDTVKDQRNKLIILFGAMMGLRAFEMAGLTWQSISPDCTTIRMKGKGDKMVDMTIPRQLREELLRWKQAKPAGAKAVLPRFQARWNPETMKREIVPLWDTSITDQAFRYIVAEAGELVGEHLTPHDLRRTFAGILEAKGWSLKRIQEAMRHSNVATTDRYLSQNPARLKKLMDEVEWEI